MQEYNSQKRKETSTSIHVLALAVPRTPTASCGRSASRAGIIVATCESSQFRATKRTQNTLRQRRHIQGEKPKPNENTNSKSSRLTGSRRATKES